MNRFLASRSLLSFFIVSISAGIITAWIVYPQTGPFGWIKNASNHQLILKGFVLSLILATGAAVTYIAFRLAQFGDGEARRFGSVAEARMIKIPQSRKTVAAFIAKAAFCANAVGERLLNVFEEPVPTAN
jgi:hypothetical protein